MKHSMKKIALTSMMSLSLIAGSLTLTPASALAAMNNGGMNAMNGQRGGQLLGIVAAPREQRDGAGDVLKVEAPKEPGLYALYDALSHPEVELHAPAQEPGLLDAHIALGAAEGG